MKTRLLTAAIGIPFIIFTLWMRGWFGELVVVFFALVGLWECYNALKKAGYRPCEVGGYAGAICMWPISRAMGVLDPLMLAMAAMGISMSGVLLRKEPRFQDAAVSVYPLLICLVPFAMFMMLFNAVYDQVTGVALIVLAFTVAFCCDSAAYFGGRALGRHKLCPTVSPKKTVEGAVFGLLGGTIGAVICRYVMIDLLHMAMPGVMMCFVIGLVGAFASQVGDLTASLLKRHGGLKDYGNIFPGHGGVMDRLDSVIFSLIVVYCSTLFM